MKKLILLSLISSLTLMIVGCGGGDSAADEATPAKPPSNDAELTKGQEGPMKPSTD